MGIIDATTPFFVEKITHTIYEIESM